MLQCPTPPPHRYFKQGPWPEVKAISDLVDHDHVFCLLYKV
jgi:translation initiation factor 3 subunit L